MTPQLPLNRILLINTMDARSLDFIASLSGEEYASFTEIIDWYNPADLGKVQNYMDMHFPSPHDFPCCAVLIPRTVTFFDDQIVLVTGTDETPLTYRHIINESEWQAVSVWIEKVQMSEAYKVAYLKKKLMVNAKIKAEALMYFMVCSTVAELKLMYQRLALEGVLVEQDAALIQAVKQEINEDLGEVLQLTTPPEPVPLPQGVKSPPPRMLVLE